MTTEAAPVAFSCRFHAPVDRNWMWTITAREYHRQSIIGAIRRATSNGGGFQRHSPGDQGNGSARAKPSVGRHKNAALALAV